MSDGRRYQDGFHAQKKGEKITEIVNKPVSSVVAVEDRDEEMAISPIVTSKEEETGELPNHFTAFMPTDNIMPTDAEKSAEQESPDLDAE
jgi:hypothetical protein